MAMKVLFQYIFICHCIRFALGTVIDAQKHGSSSNVHVHCLSSGSVIQIKDPFSRSINNDKEFIAVEWYQLLPSGNEKPKETLLLQFLKNKTNAPLEKFTIFEFWGLQINNVGLDDSATYKAKLVHLGPGQEWSAHIVVATPPVLESEKLSVSKSVSKDSQSVAISCGRVSSLGSPPVSFHWKADSGAEIPAVYHNGYLQMNISSDLDSEKPTCDLDFSAPAARCIPEKDMPRWALSQSSTVQSADMTDIIVAACVAGVVIAIIIIIIVAITLRKRFPRPEVYNARKHEKKHDQENGFVNEASLHKEKAHERSKESIYNGFSSQDSFMITQLSEGNTGPIYKKAKSQNSPTKDMVYLNGNHNTHTGKFNTQMGDKDKQGTEHNNKKQINDKDFPETSPRSIFLTPSMEALDRTGKSLNGALSNGSAINRGTLV